MLKHHIHLCCVNGFPCPRKPEILDIPELNQTRYEDIYANTEWLFSSTVFDVLNDNIIALYVQKLILKLIREAILYLLKEWKDYCAFNCVFIWLSCRG